MAELRQNIVFHRRHVVRHLGICNQICVKLLQVMSGVIPSNLKQKRRLYLKPFSWGPQTRHTHTDRQTDTHTQTHDDSIRRTAMRCISPKNHYFSALTRPISTKLSPNMLQLGLATKASADLENVWQCPISESNISAITKPIWTKCYSWMMTPLQKLLR